MEKADEMNKETLPHADLKFMHQINSQCIADTERVPSLNSRDRIERILQQYE